MGAELDVAGRLTLRAGSVELDVATGFGPRIVGYARDGRQVLGDAAGAETATPAGRWRAYPGHRLWLAPERFPETYRIDDAPPRIERLGERRVRMEGAPDAGDIRTRLDVTLHEDGSVTVLHEAEHRGDATRAVALWGITVVRAGGTFVLPLPPFAPHPEALLPAASLALWPYARLGDPRVSWNDDAIRVRVDPSQAAPWKIGTSGEPAWCAYEIDGAVFTKRTVLEPLLPYADRGSAVECFTAGAHAELETLGPLVALAPGDTLRHIEVWTLA